MDERFRFEGRTYRLKRMGGVTHIQLLMPETATPNGGTRCQHYRDLRTYSEQWMRVLLAHTRSTCKEP